MALAAIVPHQHGGQIHPSFAFSIIAAFSVLVATPAHGYNPRNFNVSYDYEERTHSNWAPAAATWFGNRDGAGNDAGSCGYKSIVERPPMNKMLSAGSHFLYKSGKGCGACYQVKCAGHQACSRKPVRVTITDTCPCCTKAPVHFDLSGTAFGAMARPGQSNQLLNAGVLHVQHKRVNCNYRGVKVAVSMDPGSNPHYLAIIIVYSAGDGSLKSVEVTQDRQNTWTPVQSPWGATWIFDSGASLQAPLSIKLTRLESGKTVVMNNVIPANWQPGQTYASEPSFDD